jgi:hypothetical protein
MLSPLPIGGLPQELLAALLSRAPVCDPRVRTAAGFDTWPRPAVDAITKAFSA